MNFIPCSETEKKEMQKKIGIDSNLDLFSDIPHEILLKNPIDLEGPRSESDVIKHLEKIAQKNTLFKSSFLGAGSYWHYIPSVVDNLSSRSEFLTAYTPYQAEMSQGILQTIFEYQTAICNIFAMDVANASLYDCAQSVAEATSIAINKTGKKKVIISKASHMDYKATVKTYLNAKDRNLTETPWKDSGTLDLEALKKQIDENTAALIVENPNFFGNIEDLKSIADIVHKNNSLLIVSIKDPTAYGLLNPPGNQGADIVVAEGQSFGTPKSFGGPYLGIMAATDSLKRFIPGRLVGKTVDKEGKKGFILTLQAREQHIRREKASCNICSNEAAIALRTILYILALGKHGLANVADQNFRKSAYMKEKIKSLGLNLPFDSLSYNEFVVDLNNDQTIQKFKTKCVAESIEPPFWLGSFDKNMTTMMLFCVTEQNTKEDMDKIIELLGESL